jgi:subtilisin family serine protease
VYRARRGAIVVALTLVFGMLSITPARTVPAPDHVPGEVLVRMRPGASARALRGARSVEPLRAPRWHRVRIDGDVADAVARLSADPSVDAVTPNRLYRAADVPNDEWFGRQWGLRNTGQFGGTPGADVDAATAWDVTKGSDSVIVAVVDTGVARTHSDFTGQLWTNTGEIAGNRKDDEGDGFVDDVRGWDFVGDDGDPADGNGHGTHVAGIVGARGNDSSGITGVARDLKLMPLRALNSQGVGTTVDIADAFRFAAAHGAKIVNASLAGNGSDPYVSDAIGDWPQTLFVVAAGNSGADNDANDVFPCTDSHANVLCVAATNEDDGLAPFSNYGRTTVDLAAPGVNIYSTTKDGAWTYMSGTSMATPFVAGAAALVRAARPTWSVSQVRSALTGSVDHLSSLTNKTVTGGRLNALAAVTSGTDPLVTAVTRSWTGRDVTGRTFTLSGSDLIAVSNVSISGGGVTSGGVTAAGASSLAVSLSVDDAAPLGARTVTVSTVDGQTASCTNCLSVMRFDDVGPTAFAVNEIDAIAVANVTAGCGTAPARYCPASDVTRGQMAVFLVRALGEEGNLQQYQGLFEDVPASNAFARHIERLADLGITSGCTAGLFCPGAGVTREQMAAFLVRALNEVGNLVPWQGLFEDVPSTNGYATYIERLVPLGVTNGCGGDRYCPTARVTRAQMAVFLARAFNL